MKRILIFILAGLFSSPIFAQFTEMGAVIQFLYPTAILTGDSRNVVIEQGAKDPDPVIVKWGLPVPQPTLQLLKGNLQNYLDAQAQKDIDAKTKQDDLKSKLKLSDDDVQTLLQILDDARSAQANLAVK